VAFGTILKVNQASSRKTIVAHLRLTFLLLLCYNIVMELRNYRGEPISRLALPIAMALALVACGNTSVVTASGDSAPATVTAKEPVVDDQSEPTQKPAITIAPVDIAPKILPTTTVKEAPAVELPKKPSVQYGTDKMVYFASGAAPTTVRLITENPENVEKLLESFTGMEITIPQSTQIMGNLDDDKKKIGVKAVNKQDIIRELKPLKGKNVGPDSSILVYAGNPGPNPSEEDYQTIVNNFAETSSALIGTGINEIKVDPEYYGLDQKYYGIWGADVSSPETDKHILRLKQLGRDITTAVYDANPDVRLGLINDPMLANKETMPALQKSAEKNPDAWKCPSKTFDWKDFKPNEARLEFQRTVVETAASLGKEVDNSPLSFSEQTSAEAMKTITSLRNETMPAARAGVMVLINGKWCHGGIDGPLSTDDMAKGITNGLAYSEAGSEVVVFDEKASNLLQATDNEIMFGIISDAVAAAQAIRAAKS
jgi:hypothetical protein